MSMSDLELLELVEKAKQKQRGPQGPAGVGIESVEQFEEDSFTIKLTTGEHKKISLPSAKDGAVGPQGVQGERGLPGAAGRPGRDGQSGLDGADGVPGPAGSSVDTAVVNSKGHLLIGLSDGQVIDCGGVVGPAGATGDRGPAGLLGEPGVDGAAVLSGPRTPTQDDGKEGDHWIDISSQSSISIRSRVRAGRCWPACVHRAVILQLQCLWGKAVGQAVAMANCRTQQRCRWLIQAGLSRQSRCLIPLA